MNNNNNNAHDSGHQNTPKKTATTKNAGPYASGYFLYIFYIVYIFFWAQHPRLKARAFMAACKSNENT